MKARVKYPTIKQKEKKVNEPAAAAVSVNKEDQQEAEQETEQQRDDGSIVGVSEESTESVESSESVVEESVTCQEDLDKDCPLVPTEKKPKHSITRGTGTFRKKPTFVKESLVIPSREDLIAFLENESLFDSKEHRKEMLSRIRSYTKEVRQKELLSIMENKEPSINISVASKRRLQPILQWRL